MLTLSAPPWDGRLCIPETPAHRAAHVASSWKSSSAVSRVKSRFERFPRTMLAHHLRFVVGALRSQT